jgi:hypothetical protein
MKRLLLTAAVLLLFGCAHLPAIQPVDSARQARVEANCRSAFLKGRWQLVHTIDATLPGGRQAVFTGVTVFSAKDGSIHCVLMTLEGFVLFEAVDNGRVSVKRAVGPFENDHFAKGVMDDLHFLFFQPTGGIITPGRFDDGHTGCRYRSVHKRIVDVEPLATGGWRIRQYNHAGQLLRTAAAGDVDTRGVPHRLTLEAGGRNGYRLAMRLVEAIELP